MQNKENEIIQIPYFLVLLRIGPKYTEGPHYWDEHVRFIELMIDKNVVLLGGDLKNSFDNIEAAYLLYTQTQAEAEEWAARDPLVINNIYTARVLEWSLVGINVSAVHPQVRSG